MPIRDQAAQERSLDNDYGPTRAAAAPDTFEVALFTDDPTMGGAELENTTEIDNGLGGTEVVANGYARVVLSNDDWTPADGGIKASLPVTGPTPTAEWPDTVTHWGLYDPAAGLWWDVAPFVEPLDITAAGAAPVLHLAVFYNADVD